MKLSFEGAELEVEPGEAFVPTDTTRVLVQGALGQVGAGERVLDLGCGSGVVALAIARVRALPKVWLSDVHEASRASVAANFRNAGVAFEFRAGSLFEPWAGERFDVIVDDVSGVAEPLARKSRWFRNVPCASGEDGADLVVRVIEQAPAHLAPGGRLLFPVISLSNVDRILAAARAAFGTVERVGGAQWPLPPELLAEAALLEALEARGAIRIERKFGMLLGRSEVYCAR